MNTQESISKIPNASETRVSETFTLLDLLLVIVDNLRLLVLGPVVVGLIVFIIAGIWPKTYESTAILKAEQITVSLMNSAAVLDPIANSLGYTPEMPLDEARRKLKDQVQSRFNAKDKLITLIAQAESPQAAQVLALAVLQQTYAQSQPRDSEKNRLQKQMEQAKVREKEAIEAGKLLRKKMEGVGSAAVPEVAQGYAQMMRVVQESQASQLSIEQQLIGLDTSAIVQDATLPTKHVVPDRNLIAIIAVFVTAFMLFLFVFIRQVLRTISQDAELVKKLSAIQIAWRKAIGQ